VSIAYEFLHIFPAGAVTRDFDKLTTCSSCGGTCIRQTGVRLLGVSEGSTQDLGLKVRRGFRYAGVEDLPRMRTRLPDRLPHPRPHVRHADYTQIALGVSAGAKRTSGNTRRDLGQMRDCTITGNLLLRKLKPRMVP
jgi:hypothetical protein